MIFKKENSKLLVKENHLILNLQIQETVLDLGLVLDLDQDPVLDLILMTVHMMTIKNIDLVIIGIEVLEKEKVLKLKIKKNKKDKKKLNLW